MDLLRQIDHNRTPTMHQFGLNVDNKFAQVDARVLDPPMIQYGNTVQKPFKGVWRGENCQFLQPETALVWGVLNTDRQTRRSNIEEFCTMVIRKSNEKTLIDWADS